MSDLLLMPRGEELRSDLSESTGWAAYADELRLLIGELLKASGIGTLEVVDLQVNDPLPGRLSGVRNGSVLSVSDALDLVIGMAAGEGPYCVLDGGGEFHIAAAWDGAVQLCVGPEVERPLSQFRRRDVRVELSDHLPESVDDVCLVQTGVDERFWAAVRRSLNGLTMLCERWAYGEYGCRWYVVTAENISQIAEEMQPRSLVSIMVDPKLQLTPEMLDEGITAFRPPLQPGRLEYKAYPYGPDDLSDLVDDGFVVALKDSEVGRWAAVVPDLDGVIRAKWEA